MLAVAITRRELLASMVAVSASVALPDLSFAEVRGSDLGINPDRLRHSLPELSVFGRSVGGTFSDGVSRVAFPDADVARPNYAMQLMRAFGMESRASIPLEIFSGCEMGQLKPGAHSLWIAH